MCGKVMMIKSTNIVNAKIDKVLKDLMTVTSLRGKDSTGITVVTANGHVKTNKLGVPSPEAMGMKAMYELCEVNNTKFFMGHCRAATVGHVTVENAHPFYRPPVYLMHNGTVHGYRKLINTTDEVAVDSDAIALMISRMTTPSEIVKALESIPGAYSLLWYNEALKTFNMARNKERPFIIAKPKDFNILFGASEKWMLEGILLRNGFEIESITPTEVGKWYSFSLDGTQVLETPFTPKVEEFFDYRNIYTNASNWYNKRGPKKERASKVTCNDIKPMRILSVDKDMATSNIHVANGEFFSITYEDEMGDYYKSKTFINHHDKVIKTKYIVGNLVVVKILHESGVYARNNVTSYSSGLVTALRPATVEEELAFLADEEYYTSFISSNRQIMAI